MLITSKWVGRGNPLNENGLLPTVALVEYGAQAAAIHSALLVENALTDDGKHKNGPAFLGAVRELKLMTSTVEMLDQPLEIRAHSELFSDNGAIYAFSAHLRDKTLVSGKLSLLIPR